MPSTTSSIPCPCGHAHFNDCCKPFLDNRVVPDSALELMRSRYSAYTLGHEAYLKSTWYISSRPTEKLFENKTAIKWSSLEILHHEQDEQWATVEFIARYKANGRAQKLHEVSRFVKEEGRWYYLDGHFPETTK